MTANEMARSYRIPVTKTFGTRNKYYLSNVYKYKSDAIKRAKDLRSMGHPARTVRVLKPVAIPRTYHFAVYAVYSNKR